MALLKHERITSADIVPHNYRDNQFELYVTESKHGGIVEPQGLFGLRLTPEFRRWMFENREFLIRTSQRSGGMLITFPSLAAAMAFKFRWC